MSERARGATESPPRGARVAACAVILAVALGSLYLFYFRGLSNVYGDGLAHMEGARRLFDSLTPGYQEIGSVWLPLFHLLAAPLALNDFLWRTGLGGSLLSTAAFVVAAWFLFLLAWEMNRNGAAAAVTLAVFLFCPNMLYLASTPLTEPLALLWYILVAFGLFRYRETGGKRALIGSAVAAFLGTLTRYDGWYLLPFATLFVFWARQQSWDARFRHVAWFLGVAGLGPALWLIHNAYRFGNPVEFYNGPFSAQAIYAHQVATTAFRYPTDGSLLLAARYFLEDVRLVIGVWPLELAVLGLVVWAADRTERRRRSAALLLLPPFLFYVHSLAYAGVPLYVPTLFPYSYYNLRYGLEILPALAILPSFLLSPRLSGWARYGLLTMVLGLLVGQAVSTASRGLSELAVAKEGVLNTPCRSKRQQAIVRFFQHHYDGQRVLTAAGKWPCLMPEIGIPFRNTISQSNREYWDQARMEPQKLVEWIIRSDGDVVNEMMRADLPSFRDFVLLEKFTFPGEGGVAIYRRRAP